MRDSLQPGSVAGHTGFSRRKTDVNGTRLSVVVGGTGPTIVLLHGWPQTGSSWRHVMGPLAAAGFTVVVPDLRGTGSSERATDGYSKDDQAEDIRQAVAQLGLGSEISLVGHDIGGMVAFAYARLNPSDVRHLALIDLALPGLGLEEAMDPAHGGLFHFGLFMTPEVPELLFAGHEREFFQWWFHKLGADPAAYSPEVIDAATEANSGPAALRGGFDHYRTLLADGRVNRAWADDGGTLAMPVLALGGEHSAGTTLFKSLGDMATDISGGQIAGTGHFVPEERPDALVEELLRFLGTPA